MCFAREQARPAVWGTPQYGDLWQRALSVGERQEAAQGTHCPLLLPLDAVCASELGNALSTVLGRRDLELPWPRARAEPAFLFAQYNSSTVCS